MAGPVDTKQTQGLLCDVCDDTDNFYSDIRNLKETRPRNLSRSSSFFKFSDPMILQSTVTSSLVVLNAS